ncbi:hypothetical protein [Aquabacterium sp.]|uniref:hypothetical protein n=1 Tax=Aquabacterium sp. TaxID=1872578 RepID=UPI002486E16C|nr:hypothetical protein [Aquabacterium sp.]MDI1258270.1 hypothetical protein [Aquabacterium sp.]
MKRTLVAIGVALLLLVGANGCHREPELDDIVKLEFRSPERLDIQIVEGRYKAWLDLAGASRALQHSIARTCISGALSVHETVEPWPVGGDLADTEEKTAAMYVKAPSGRAYTMFATTAPSGRSGRIQLLAKNSGAVEQAPISCGPPEKIPTLLRERLGILIQTGVYSSVRLLQGMPNAESSDRQLQSFSALGRFSSHDKFESEWKSWNALLAVTGNPAASNVHWKGHRAADGLQDFRMTTYVFIDPSTDRTVDVSLSAKVKHQTDFSEPPYAISVQLIVE